MSCSLVDKYQHIDGTCCLHSPTLMVEETDSFEVLVHTARLHGVIVTSKSLLWWKQQNYEFIIGDGDIFSFPFFLFCPNHFDISELHFFNLTFVIHCRIVFGILTHVGYEQWKAKLIYICIWQIAGSSGHMM
jgi:hypothetical protein